jgi:hypothetical protein
VGAPRLIDGDERRELRIVWSLTLAERTDIDLIAPSDVERVVLEVSSGGQWTTCHGEGDGER